MRRRCMRPCTSNDILAVAALALLIPSASTALDVTVEWTPPRLYSYPPPANLLYEGSVTAEFAGDQPMGAIDTPWIIPTGDRTFVGTWLWDDTAAREAVFAAGGDTVAVTAERRPFMPLDPSAHDGLVMVVETAPANLWSPETGIYVWGLYENCLQRGSEWERPAQLTAYAPGGAVLWTEPTGLRINGQSSRYHTRKGLRSYFDDYGAADWLEADLFGAGPERFGRLVHKSTVMTSGMVSSSLFEPLHIDLGHFGSRHRLAGLYLNGEYWGAYSLRERYDDHIVEITHALAEDGDYTLLKDDEAEEGDVQEWYDFLAAWAVPPQPYGSHDWFTGVAARLDLPSYMDWMALNILGASADNGWVNNIALLKVGDGPWRYCMWDEEGLMIADNLASDHFRFYASADNAEFEQFRPPVWSMGDWWAPHQPWRDLFRGLMQNSEFKAMFSARWDELLAGPASVSSLHARLDSLEAAHAVEMARHEVRWRLPAGQHVAEMARVRQWLVDRTPIVQGQKQAFFEHFAVPVELSRFDAVADTTGALLTWRTERERDNRGFQVWRALEQPDQWQLLADWSTHPELVGAPDSDAPREYAFTDAGFPPGGRAWYQLRHETVDGAVIVHDWVERAGPPALPMLRLNELMADNDQVIADEAGEFEDWIEIHNPGAAAVSLAGLALSDDPGAAAPWPLPDLTIEPGGYLVVWCDNDTDQGPLHADFKLSADGESAALFLVDGGVPYPVDVVTFGPQATDVAYGRYPDGDGPWQTLPVATPGGPNSIVTAATPAGLRGVILHASPNPAGERVAVSLAVGDAAAGRVDVGVYDLRGRLVRRLLADRLPAGMHDLAWDRRDDAGRRAPAGVYLLRADTATGAVTRKLSLVR
jgi:hypothetical protein